MATKATMHGKGLNPEHHSFDTVILLGLVCAYALKIVIPLLLDIPCLPILNFEYGLPLKAYKDIHLLGLGSRSNN